MGSASSEIVPVYHIRVKLHENCSCSGCFRKGTNLSSCSQVHVQLYSIVTRTKEVYWLSFDKFFAEN